MSSEQNRSEIARIRQQIEAEYQAGKQALYGLSCGSSKHEVINARMERIGTLQEELAGLVGHQESIHLLRDILEESSHPQVKEASL